MVDHSKLLESFDGDIVTAPPTSFEGKHISADSRRVLAELGIPGDFDDLIVVDSEFERMGPRTMEQAYESVGDQPPDSIRHLYRFASCRFDSLCFDGETGTVYLVPSDNPEDIIEVAESLTVFINRIYTVKVTRDQTFADLPGRDEEHLQAARDQIKQKVDEIGNPGDQRTDDFWRMLITDTTTPLP